MTTQSKLQEAVKLLTARWLGDAPNARHHYSPERRGMTHQAEILSLPVTAIPPIQDFSGSTPGRFDFMLDYDPLP